MFDSMMDIFNEGKKTVDKKTDKIIEKKTKTAVETAKKEASKTISKNADKIIIGVAVGVSIFTLGMCLGRRNSQVVVNIYK